MDVPEVLMAEQFSLNAITNNDLNYWRIDWFGYITYRALTSTGSSATSWPYVKVFLSKVRYPDKGFDLNNIRDTDFYRYRSVIVPIEYLCLLRLGDVWHKGSLFRSGEQNHSIETFENVIISRETTTAIQAKSKSQSGNFYLHYSHHPYHGNATLVNCTLIMLEDGTQLVIPDYVIAQTYFSASSYVFSELFRHGLNYETLYDSNKSFVDQSGNAFIHLKQRVHDSAAPQIARIAFDENTRKAASLLTDSLVMYAQRADWSLIPRVTFPFVGATDLKVYGKRCPGPENIFVVFGILACSAKFPFNRLQYFRDAPGDKDPEGDNLCGSSDDESLPGGHRKSRGRISEKFNLDPESEPDKSLLNIDLTGRDSPYFAYLETIVVEKVRVEPHLPKMDSGHGGGTKDVASGNSAGGSARGTAAPVSFEAGSRYVFPQELCRLKRFHDVFNLLSKQDHVLQIRYRKVNETIETEGTNYSAFPEVLSGSGLTLQWPYLNYIQGIPRIKEDKPKRRMVAIVELVTRDKTLYLFESQRGGTAVSNGWVEIDDIGIHLLQMHDDTVLSDYQLQVFLDYSARNRGTWGFPESAEPACRCTTLKHPDSSKVGTADYETEIVKKILSNLV